MLSYAPHCRGAVEHRKLASEILGDSTPVKVSDEVSPKRGLQKDLFALFSDVEPVETSPPDAGDVVNADTDTVDDTGTTPETHALAPLPPTDHPSATGRPLPSQE